MIYSLTLLLLLASSSVIRSRIFSKLSSKTCHRIDDSCAFLSGKSGRIVWAKRQRQSLSSPLKLREGVKSSTDMNAGPNLKLREGVKSSTDMEAGPNLKLREGSQVKY